MSRCRRHVTTHAPPRTSQADVVLLLTLQDTSTHVQQRLKCVPCEALLSHAWRAPELRGDGARARPRFCCCCLFVARHKRCDANTLPQARTRNRPRHPRRPQGPADPRPCPPPPFASGAPPFRPNKQSLTTNLSCAAMAPHNRRRQSSPGSSRCRSSCRWSTTSTTRSAGRLPPPPAAAGARGPRLPPIDNPVPTPPLLTVRPACPSAAAVRGHDDGAHALPPPAHAQAQRRAHPRHVDACGLPAPRRPPLLRPQAGAPPPPSPTQPQPHPCRRPLPRPREDTACATPHPLAPGPHRDGQRRVCRREACRGLRDDCLPLQPVQPGAHPLHPAPSLEPPPALRPSPARASGAHLSLTPSHPLPRPAKTQDPHCSHPDASKYDRAASLGALLQESDVLSLHCQPPEDAPHLLREAELRLCKRGAVVVNTCSGALVEPVALKLALQEGVLGGAALDAPEGARAGRLATPSLGKS